MDSPVFGSSTSNPNPKLFFNPNPNPKTNNNISSDLTIINTQYVLALLLVERNVRRFCAAIGAVVGARKREALLAIRMRIGVVEG